MSSNATKMGYKSPSDRIGGQDYDIRLWCFLLGMYAAIDDMWQ